MSAVLHEHGAEAVDDVATLLASELVTNAVLHARSAVELRLRLRDGRLRVEVHDGSRVPVTPRRFGAEAATGRGLVLVTELAQSWGSEVGPDGKLVWFELSAGGGGDWQIGESA